ncbi:MAG: hypothetical protein BWY70_01664 [Bacteroidetes bacterium ADurb.Bin408]|nr:MAG: hypothetical protein BWY70_01664 [Bacteroidetes bacterium ADurb.Bin408]
MMNYCVSGRNISIRAGIMTGCIASTPLRAGYNGRQHRTFLDFLHTLTGIILSADRRTCPCHIHKRKSYIIHTCAMRWYQHKLQFVMWVFVFKKKQVSPIQHGGCFIPAYITFVLVPGTPLLPFYPCPVFYYKSRYRVLVACGIPA